MRVERAVDVGVGGRGLDGQQRGRGHDLPRLAVAALRDFLGDPFLLHDVRFGWRESLDRRHRLLHCRTDGGAAGSCRLSVDVHSAGGALADAAAVLGAAEAERVAEHP